MNGERAERHLRLAAEAGLRRSRTRSGSGMSPGSQAVSTDCIARLAGVARALTAVGALDARQAEEILTQFRDALAVRDQRPRQAAGPLLRPVPTRMIRATAPGADPGAATGAAAPWRVFPVARMLPFRDEFVAGELYVLSLLVTAERAQALALAPVRPAIAGGPGLVGFPEPLTKITATDDWGTGYQVNFYGGRDATITHWEGQLSLQPAPPAGARWLELAMGGSAARVRIDLTAAAPATDVALQPPGGPPGEQLLEQVAQEILAASAGNTGDARRRASGLGDVVAALEAAGALSLFSPVPGYLAMICERLGAGPHGVTAAPTAGLPGPWLSVLAWYGRRHRPAVHDGTASTGLVLPEVDGAQVAVTGLHTRGSQTFLHVVADRAQTGRLAADAGPLRRPGFCGWLRDDAGQWHVAVPAAQGGDGFREVSGSLQVLPPLGRGTSRVTLLFSTLTGQVRADVPLRWWAAP
ncbi:MAG TPA: hypothetical protein VGD68_05100 [Streptosporangiaceae bacterium]